MSIKVLLDTDIGTDVDDAVALAYLLAQRECDLVGITTVSGEPIKRASLVSAMCRAAGRDVPIYPGAEHPLYIAQRQTVAQHAVALGNWSHETQFPEGQAVDFMRRVIRENPGEVVLLTIGPLTNIAQLFQADPDIPALLKSLVTMGGIFDPNTPFMTRDGVEWNLMLDPHATRIVYDAPAPLHRSVGLDVTAQVVLTAAEVRARFTAPLLRPVLDFAEIWFTQWTPPGIAFHDPLTAATIFDESLCAYERGTVHIDLETLPGKSTFYAGEAPARHEVARSVERGRYLDHFFGVFQ